jgi:hypothetical protein
MMGKSLFAIAAIAATLGAAAATPAHAFNDPDWPCVQRKMLHLSIGQMWAGPPVPEDPDAWRSDDALASMIATIAARRTPLEDVEEMVAGLEGEGDRSREDRLLALFAGTFERIDRDRARIVDGITRLAKRERERAERIDAMRAEIDALKESAKPEDYDALDRIEEMEDELAWETRIYADRRRSLTFVCESPVILEQRAFAVSRMVMEALEG